METRRASGVVHAEAACTGEALPSAFSAFLGREERVEDLVARRFGDAGAGVPNRDLDRLAVEPCAYRDLAESTGVIDYVRYRVRRIHQQVQDHLVDLAEIARHGGQLAELR